MHEGCKWNTGCKRTGRMGQLGRAKTGLGTRQLKSWRAKLACQLGTWRANFAVGARQVPSWRANFDLASEKLASTEKTHMLQHINKATQP